MKIFAVLCVVVGCAAGYPGYLGHGYGLPQQVVDTHEVAVAKAQHFAAVEEAKIRIAQAGHGLDHGYGSGGYSGAVSNIHIHHPQSYGHGGHYGGYSGHAGYATGHEVEIATAQHLAAHAKEAARHAHGGYGGGYEGHGGHYGGYSGHAGYATGHEVEIATAQHLAAHAKEAARHGLASHGAGYAAGYGSYGGHGWQYGNGLAPGQDTHEVAIAKAQHFAAHAAAKAQHGHY